MAASLSAPKVKAEGSLKLELSVAPVFAPPEGDGVDGTFPELGFDAATGAAGGAGVDDVAGAGVDGGLGAAAFGYLLSALFCGE